MNLNIIFTWWNKQTFGTFLKTLFYGAYVGKDEFGNKYYKSKQNERWVVYSNNIEATKITSDWYLWIHHTVDKVPEEKDSKKGDESIMVLNRKATGAKGRNFATWFTYDRGIIDEE